MTVKIIAFPYAGGNEYSYRAIEKYIPFNFKWICIEIPRVYSISNQVVALDFNEIINYIFQEVKKHIESDIPYLIYGHSLGTIIAYEVIRKIVKSGIRQPKLLFLTGRGAPNNKSKKVISHLAKSKFLEEVKSIGGFDPLLLSNKDFVDFIEPILRRDFIIAETYQYKRLEKPLNIPIFIVLGKEEVNISQEELLSWQDVTNIPINSKRVDGGHFFIFKEPERLAKNIINAYRNLRFE